MMNVLFPPYQQFVVMQGKVECIFGDLNEKYSVGSKVSIPKGLLLSIFFVFLLNIHLLSIIKNSITDTIYGLRNPGKVECLLQYQAF